MRKEFLHTLAFAAALLCCATAAQAQRFMPVGTTEINGQRVKTIIAAPGTTAPKSAQADAQNTISQRKKVTKTVDILVNEDFSKMTAGSEEAIDTTLLCSFYGIDNQDYYIDPSYTKKAGWTGDNIFQAGGMVAALDHNITTPAVLNTPLGDYSGDIVITFKVKALDIEDNNCHIYVNLLENGVDNPSVPEGDDVVMNAVHLYPYQGWTEATMTMTCRSARNDAFVQFCIYGSVLIDDIKVTAGNDDFIAAPVILPMTEYTDSSFTANWEPVRKAYNYYAYLYKKNYLSDADGDFFEDFENGLPTNWGATSGVTVEEGVGLGGSKGAVLQTGDTLVTPDYNVVYHNLWAWLKVNKPSDDTDMSSSYITISWKKNGTWKSFGYMGVSSFLEGDAIDLDTEALGAFADMATAVRFTTMNFPEGATLVVDSVAFTTDRPWEYEAVGSRHNYTTDTHYTFTGLDPQTEYCYAIVSHLMKLYSEEIVNDAFGASMPNVLTATDIDERGGYTANWEPVQRATSYIVTNYGVNTCAEDGEVVLLDEDFAKIDASVTDATDMLSGERLGNTTEESYDDYTTLPGWKGTNNTLAQSALGTIAGYIQTPPLYVANDSAFYLYIEAYGYYGDYLYIDTPDDSYSIAFYLDESDASGYKGILKGWLGVPVTSKNMTLKFSTLYGAYGYPLAFDKVKVSQNMHAGDTYYTYLGSQEVDASESSCRFSGLSDYDYTTFAYTVTAKNENGTTTATSDATDYVLVDLVSGDSKTHVNAIQGVSDGTAVPSEFYNAGGQRTNQLQRGMNIVRMSDGTTRKVIIK